MSKIKGTHKIVYECLLNEPVTRSDDYLLILSVLKYYVTPQMTLEAVLLNHSILGIPSIETITRCRRKIQEQHPELTNETIKAVRMGQQEEYIQYALNIK